jgi:guanine deaminase
MQWLDKYTIKAEEGLDTDILLARRVYEQLEARLIEHETGAVLLFGTIEG